MHALAGEDIHVVLSYATVAVGVAGTETRLSSRSRFASFSSSHLFVLSDMLAWLNLVCDGPKLARYMVAAATALVLFGGLMMLRPQVLKLDTVPPAV